MCKHEREERMKISLKITTLISCIVITLGLISTLIACDAEGGDPPKYFVSFTLDGTPYVLTGGYTTENTFDAGANGNHRAVIVDVDGNERDTIRIAAIDASLSDMDIQGPYIFLTIVAKATNVPITPGSYDGEGGTGFNIAVDGDTSVNDDAFDTFSLELISSADSVGGVIQGTFSGTYNGGLSSLENGIFSVERLADGSISKPSRFPQ